MRWPAVVFGVVGVLAVAAGLAYAAWPNDTPAHAGRTVGYSPAAPAPTATAGPRPQVTVDLTRLTRLPARFSEWDTGGFTPGPHLARSGLTAGPSTSANQAAYVETRLSRPLRIISATVTFTGNHRGTLALVDWSSSNTRARSSDGRSPFAPIHFAITTRGWVLGVFNERQSHAVRMVKTQPVDLSAGSHGVTLSRSGETVTVTVDGGYPVAATDPAFVKATGWACWELFAHRAGDQPPAISAISAG